MLSVLRKGGSARTTMTEPAGQSARRVSTVAGAVLAVVGLLVLTGWTLELESLKAVLPGFATMKANTALCFLLAGVALVLRERRAVRLACASLVGTVAGLTLAEYVSGGNFGLDQFLFRDMQNQHTIYPGRMVEATAMGFLLSSASLLLLKTRSRSALRAQLALAAGVAIIGAMAVLGYFYDVQQLYRFAGFSSMALHTAASFVVLAAGLILARPDGLAAVLMAPGPGAQLTRLLLPSAILVPAVMGWLIQSGLRQGFYGEGMDNALLALLMIVALTTMVLWSARALNRSDAARREIESQLRNLTEVMNHAHEPLIVREPGGVIRAWNRGAEMLYGWPADDALGQSRQTLLCTEGYLMEEINRLLKSTGRWEGELIHTTRGGRRITVESRQTASRTGDGQILILESNLDITERKQSEAQLKATLTEKEVMLKEIHHRVKNNLQVISSLVGLQADGTKDETVREVLRDVTYRVRSMALVHEKLYQSGDLARIDFAEYTKSLLNYLWRAHGSVAAAIRLTYDLEPLSLPVDIAVPCGLILNELAGNALKHAFRGRAEGEVAVSLHRAPEGHIALCLRDNGVGLPPELDWRQSPSLGLQLVQMLAGQLNATVELSVRGGTEFRMTFKPTEMTKDGEPLHE